MPSREVTRKQKVPPKKLDFSGKRKLLHLKIESKSAIDLYRHDTSSLIERRME
jgi:hypothetical protein